MNKPFFEMIQDKLHSEETEDRDVKITADFKMSVEPDLEYEEELKEVLEAKGLVPKVGTMIEHNSQFFLPNLLIPNTEYPSINKHTPSLNIDKYDCSDRTEFDETEFNRTEFCRTEFCKALPVRSNQLNADIDYIKDIYLKFFNEFEKLDICSRGAAAFDTPASKVFAKRKILEDLTNNLLALWSIESQIEENNEIKNKLERIKNEL